MATGNRIHLQGDVIREEGVSTATVSPGMLCARTSVAGKFGAHGVEGGVAEALVAQEDILQGKTIEDNYTADDIMQMNHEQKGNKTKLLLKAGENIARGSLLTSAGDGTVIAIGSVSSGVTANAIAVADEALDISASGEGNTLVDAWII